MSTHVVGFKPPDDKWTKMKAAWDACEAAGISAPPAVVNFFNYATPDPAGVEIDEKALLKCGAVRKWNEREMCDGYEIDVSKLPPDVKIIRVYNSY